MQRRSRKGTSTKGRRTGPRLETRNRARSTTTSVVFGRNLRRVCRARQLSATDLSKLIGRTQRTVERILAGDATLGLALISDIARKLDVPVAELVRDL